MFEQDINSDTKRVLNQITGAINEKGFYLAGGTGLSLLIGHRESVDLDFFTDQDFDPKELAKSLNGFVAYDQKPGTLIGKIENVNISFFEYKYPMLAETINYNSIQIASILDIAMMKLSAIMDRNTKRDFIDLYFVCNNYFSLSELINQFRIKYVGTENLVIPILKSLVYFVDTESETMPHMLKEIKWEEIKEYFKKEVSKVYSKLT